MKYINPVMSFIVCLPILSFSLQSFSGERETDLGILEKEIHLFSKELREMTPLNYEKEYKALRKELELLDSEKENLPPPLTTEAYLLRHNFEKRQEIARAKAYELNKGTRLKHLSEMFVKESATPECKDFNLRIDSIQNDLLNLQQQVQAILSLNESQKETNPDESELSEVQKKAKADEFQSFLKKTCRFVFLVKEFRILFPHSSFSGRPHLDRLEQKYDLTSFCAKGSNEPFDSKHPALNGLPPAKVEVLKKYGFTPKYEFKVYERNEKLAQNPHAPPLLEKKFYLTQSFKGTTDRDFFWAIFPFEGKSYIRLIWKSNSQGIFKFTPNVIFNPHSKILQYQKISKGPGEQYLSVPQEIQEYLLKNSEKMRSEPFIDLYGEAFIDEMQKAGGDQDEKMIHFKIEKNLLVSRERKLVGDPKRRIRHPHDLVFQDEKSNPNFELEEKFETHFMGDPATVYVVPSINDRFEYIFIEDQDHYVWVADIHVKQGPLNEFGVRQEGLETSRITAPVWEYRQQVPEGFLKKNVSKKRYGNQAPFVEEIDVIKRFRNAHQKS